MQLSKNFNLKEFTYSEVTKKHLKPTEFQIEKLRYLAENLLQPIRDKFGPLKITSGLRDLEVYRALVKAGYPASKTSDHFLVPYLYKYNDEWLVPTWAPNPRGRGAADFIALKTDAWDLWFWVLDEFKKPGWDFNQFIIYPKKYSSAKVDYFHISNPSHIFPAKSITPSRNPLLVYVNGNRKFKGAKFVSFKEFKRVIKGF